MMRRSLPTRVRNLLPSRTNGAGAWSRSDPSSNSRSLHRPTVRISEMAPFHFPAPFRLPRFAVHSAISRSIRQCHTHVLYEEVYVLYPPDAPRSNSQVLAVCAVEIELFLAEPTRVPEHGLEAGDAGAGFAPQFACQHGDERRTAAEAFTANRTHTLRIRWNRTFTDHTAYDLEYKARGLSGDAATLSGKGGRATRPAEAVLAAPCGARTGQDARRRNAPQSRQRRARGSQPKRPDTYSESPDPPGDCSHPGSNSSIQYPSINAL